MKPVIDYPFPHKYERELQDRGRIIYRLTEAVVQRGVVAWLHAKHIPAWPQDAGGKETRKMLFRNGLNVRAGGLSDLPEGWPDVIGILPGGRFLALEVKKPNYLDLQTGRQSGHGNPTERQLEMLYLMHRHGALVGVVWSVQDVERLVLPYLEATA